MEGRSSGCVLLVLLYRCCYYCTRENLSLAQVTHMDMYTTSGAQNHRVKRVASPLGITVAFGLENIVFHILELYSRGSCCSKTMHDVHYVHLIILPKVAALSQISGALVAPL